MSAPTSSFEINSLATKALPTISDFILGQDVADTNLLKKFPTPLFRFGGTMSGLLELNQGADKVSGTALTVPSGGNYFDVTGAVTIDTMATTGIQGGTEVTLQFDGAPLINHAVTADAFSLAGQANFQTAALDTLTVILGDDGVWHEVARRAPATGGEVFTWTADHNTGANTFIFSGAGGDPGAGVVHQRRVSTNSFRTNIATGGEWRIDQNGVEFVNFGSTIDWRTKPHAGITNLTMTGTINGCTGIEMNGQFELKQGADEASASELTLSLGNSFDVTGTTTINEISTTGWAEGAVITLQFDGSLLFKHLSGSSHQMILATGQDWQTRAGDTIRLIRDSATEWRELARNSSGRINLGVASTLTEVSDAVTITSSWHLIAGESASADDLATINGGTVGDTLYIQPSSDTIDITVVDTGNIVLAGALDFVMDSENDIMQLLFDDTNWVEVSRSSNNA